MKYKANNAKRDQNEPEIVQALQTVGAEVYRLNTPADLLVGFRGANYLIEVKMPKGKLTPDQIKFQQTWTGQYAVVRTADEALRVIGVDV